MNKTTKTSVAAMLAAISIAAGVSGCGQSEKAAGEPTSSTTTNFLDAAVGVVSSGIDSAASEVIDGIKSSVETAEPEKDTDEFVSTESDDTFTYDVYQKHVEIKSYSGSGREATVPDEFKGLPVTVIGDSVFATKKDLTKVNIGKNVKKISDLAFNDCELLLEVCFSAPEKLEIIENWSFKNCKLLKALPTFPALKDIGYQAFSNTAITNFTVPSGVSTIPGECFKDSKLKNIVIENGVTKINLNAFENTDIESLVIPNSVTELESKGSCLADCNNLKEVIIGSGIKTLGSVFENCSVLEKVTLSEGLEDIQFNAFYHCTSLTEIDIPSTVKRLGSADNVGTNIGVFDNCTSLKKITLHEGLEEICDRVFQGSPFGDNNIPLSSITIPKTVTSIGNSAFTGLKNLSEITIPGSVLEISDSAFYGCPSLKQVVVDEGVIKIGKNTFGECPSLESVILPDSIVQIDPTAFDKDTYVYVTYKGKTYTSNQLDALFSLINDGIPAEVVDTNFVRNFSFEDDRRDMWQITNVDDKTTLIDYQEKESDAFSGKYALHFWGETGSEFYAQQEISGIPEGTYTLTASVQGDIDSGDHAQDIYIFVKIGDADENMLKASAELLGFANWQHPTISDIKIQNNQTVYVGIYVKAGNGSWGTIDDFVLSPQQ